MQLAAALLEYVVTGVVASMWLVPLSPYLLGTALPFDEALALLYLPAAYVVGLLVDTTASFLLTNLKSRHRSSSGGRSYGRTVVILTRGPERLAHTLQLYTGRDRIARGLFLNACLAAAVWFWVSPEHLRSKVGWACVFVALWAITVWRRLDRLTLEFTDRAVDQLTQDRAAHSPNMTDSPKAD
jgi:hypothetical protein